MNTYNAIYVVLFISLSIGSCAAAVGWGAAPERLAVAAMLLAMVLSNATAAIAQQHFGKPQIGIMLTDIALAIVLVIIALRAQRYWPMWAASVQIDAIATHVVMFSARTPPFSYGSALHLWSLLLPGLVVVGSWRHRSRVQSYGKDLSWSPRL